MPETHRQYVLRKKTGLVEIVVVFSTNDIEKQIMPFQTTINWLFNDI